MHIISLTQLFSLSGAQIFVFLTATSPRWEFDNFLFGVVFCCTIVIRSRKEIIQMLHIRCLDHFFGAVGHNWLANKTNLQKGVSRVVHEAKQKGGIALSDNFEQQLFTSPSTWWGRIGNRHVSTAISSVIALKLQHAPFSVHTSSMEQKYNLNNPSIKRIMREVKEMEKETSCQFKARPLEVR